jgi:thiol-disulfide isomerase/thioredoxin
MRRALAVAVAAVVILAGCGGGDGEQVSYDATDLVTGEDVSIDAFEGRPVLLVSWATWCAECDELLGGLQAFAESPGADGIEVIAVNLDASGATAEVDDKIAAHGLTTTLWRDRRNEFKRAFNALGVPTSVVLDPEGSVVATFPGAVDFDGVEVTLALDTARSGGSA